MGEAAAPLIRPRRPPLSWVGGLVLLVGLMGLTLLGQRQALQRRQGWPPEADNLYLPSAGALARMSLGHRELAADLVAVRANIYFGSQVLAKASPRWLERYVHTTLDLDPHFRRMYLAGAAMLLYNGRPITVETIESANQVLQRGVDRFPFEWEHLFQLGFNQFFELPTAAGEDDPRVPQWRQRGIEALRQATMFEGVPPWAPNLVARMLTKRGSEGLAIKHLEQAYAVATSQEVRDQIRLKLTSMHADQLSQTLEEDRLRFEAQMGERYPYAPEAFSVVAGPRLPRSVEIPYRSLAR